MSIIVSILLAVVSSVLLVIVIMYKLKNKRIRITFKEKLAENDILYKKVSSENTTLREEIAALKNIDDKQKMILDEKEETLRKSFNYAKYIHNSILPDKKYLNSILGDYFIFFRRKSEIACDFYWVKQYAHKIIFVVSDTKTHDISSAFKSGLSVVFFNDIITTLTNQDNEEEKITAADFINMFNDKYRKILAIEDNKNTRSIGFSVVIIDILNKKLEFAGSYHSIYLMKKIDPKSKVAELHEFKGDRINIGADRQQKFKSHVLEIKSGDVIYLFTDGILHQIGGKNNKSFTSMNLKKLLITIHAKPMSEQYKIISSTMKKWIGNNPIVDDMLVIGIKL